MAGLCAAIKAIESQINVLVVDKGGIGWSGQVPVGGGSLAYIYTDQVERFCQWVTEYNQYLNNQDWTYRLAQGLTVVHKELAVLGVPFFKKNGDFAIVTLGKDNYRTKLDAPRAMLKLKNTAVSRGVKTLDKIFVADLLLKDDKVTGAIGFGLVDGKTYIFNAKSVVIATGACRFQAEKAFSWTLGEGQAMAYRAGAQLMNAEFRNFYLYTLKALDGKQFMSSIPLHLCLENAWGEKFIEKYHPEIFTVKKPGASSIDAIELLELIFAETQAGKGPIYININHLGFGLEEKEHLVTPSSPPGFKELYSFNIFRVLKDKLKIDPGSEKIEIQPLWGGGGGMLRIDLECKTTVEGLWAVGDVATNGSGWSGSRLHVMGGTGIGFAAVSGLIAGSSAGKYVLDNRNSDVDYKELKHVRERVLSPLNKSGKIDIREVIHQIHEAVVPMKYSFKREASRMNEAMEILGNAKKSLADAIIRDNHELALYYQAESMILAGELTFKAALMRQESRGQHLRQDFPSRDDINWLKWIVIKKSGESPNLHAEPIPFAGYKWKSR
jgi:succinate dehydrogenase / fumarate reductase, flavoprotein subunit